MKRFYRLAKRIDRRLHVTGMPGSRHPEPGDFGARVLLEAAGALRRENLSGQVKALALYWRAGLYCRLAEQLSR